MPMMIERMRRESKPYVWLANQPTYRHDLTPRNTAVRHCLTWRLFLCAQRLIVAGRRLGWKWGPLYRVTWSHGRRGLRLSAVFHTLVRRRHATPARAKRVKRNALCSVTLAALAGANRGSPQQTALRFHSAARLTRTSSLSLRANTLFIAKAGCDQIVIRRPTFRVGSTSFARLISS